MDTNHLINAIYRATEGEGVFLGRPQIFVRYQGCAIGCLNCDSKETWDFDQDMALSLDTIMEEIHKEGINGMIKNVSITGGDPLHPTHTPHVFALVQLLKKKNYYINIEAAGTRVVDDIFGEVDYISFDFKTPSTKVKTPLANISQMIKKYPGKFQVKAVIANESDFLATLDAYKLLIAEHGSLPFPWVLTPCFNTLEPFPLERFVNVLNWNEQAGGLFRVIGQQHKWVFGPDKKKV